MSYISILTSKSPLADAYEFFCGQHCLLAYVDLRLGVAAVLGAYLRKGVESHIAYWHLGPVLNQLVLPNQGVPKSSAIAAHAIEIGHIAFLLGLFVVFNPIESQSPGNHVD